MTPTPRMLSDSEPFPVTDPLTVDHVVRPCTWWSSTRAAAVMAPIRQGQRLTRRSALKVVLSSELPRSACAGGHVQQVDDAFVRGQPATDDSSGSSQASRYAPTLPRPHEQAVPQPCTRSIPPGLSAVALQLADLGSLASPGGPRQRSGWKAKPKGSWLVNAPALARPSLSLRSPLESPVPSSPQRCRLVPAPSTWDWV